MQRRLAGLVLALLFGFAGQASARQIVDGRTGPGSLYRLVKPPNWNGSLLLYWPTR